MSSNNNGGQEDSPPTSPADAIHNFSPPTSPPVVRLSPPTSPVGAPASTRSSCSTPSSSSSDSGSPPLKRKKYDSSRVSRSTLQRRLYDREDIQIGSPSFCDDDPHEPEDQREVSDAELDDAHNVIHAAEILEQDVNDIQNLPIVNVHEGYESDVEDIHRHQDHYAALDTISSDSSSDAAGSDNEESVSGESSDSISVNAFSDDSDNVDVDSNSSSSFSEETVHWLFRGSPLTTDEAILKILKLYVKERWTKTSLDANVKLIKSLLPQPNDLPSTGQMLLNRLKEVAPFQVEIEHFYCAKCQLSLSSLTEKCKCGCEESNVFLEYPIEPQVKYFFEHRDLASVIHRYKNRVFKEGCISDILDGSEYKKIRMKVNGQYDIVLMLNVDGVSLYLSSKQETWPILCFICEVPPSLRPSFVIVCGIYVGKSAPKMNTYLKPFVDSVKKICNSGGVQWVHPHSKESYRSNVTCSVLCADAPAKSYALNVKLHSHRFGCNVCEQKASLVALTAGEVALNQQLPARKRKRPVRRFVFQEEDAILRTGPRMQLLGHLAELRCKSRKGVVGLTVLSELPHFDPALCICAEYLHVICLGVVKYFLKLLFLVKGPWYIGDKINEIDLFFSSIKVPDFIKRLPRGMSDLKFLIGSEMRAMLLFYSLPAFQAHMKPEYFQHWMLLVGAIFNLLQEHISEHDLTAAELMLRLFVREIHELYGDKYYTYNVHNLLHLSHLVKRWGNLWATSAFDFEKFNGFIVSHVHGTKHVGKELLNNIKIIQSVQVFERIVKASKLPDLHCPLDQQTLGKQISHQELSDCEREAIRLAGIDVFKLFRRAKWNSLMFTSLHYDADKKRSNSFVEFCSDDSETSYSKYGQVLYYVEDCVKKFIHCLINVFEVKHTKIIFHHGTRMRMKHLIPVENCDQLIVIPLSRLVTKVIKAGSYLCLRPNSYEVNL